MRCAVSMMPWTYRPTSTFILEHIVGELISNLIFLNISSAFRHRSFSSFWTCSFEHDGFQQRDTVALNDLEKRQLAYRLRRIADLYTQVATTRPCSYALVPKSERPLYARSHMFKKKKKRGPSIYHLYIFVFIRYGKYIHHRMAKASHRISSGN